MSVLRYLALSRYFVRGTMMYIVLSLSNKRCNIYIPFQVMSACFEVFGTWDDEYDKLQGLLRDIVKKKREEHLKMVWRVNPAHKRLQARLDQMRK